MAKTRVIKATNKCGKRVKISRVEKDMTQLDLATALNMDYDIEISSTGVSDADAFERTRPDGNADVHRPHHSQQYSGGDIRQSAHGCG